jgi:hypothetical protein
MPDRSQRGFRRAVERALDAAIARLPHTPHEWPKYALFWGAFSIWASIILSVVVVIMTEQVRWLLLLSLPVLALALWPVVANRRLWLLITLAASGVTIWAVVLLAPETSWVSLLPATNGSMMTLFPVHRGPETLYSVSIAIDDQERLEKLGRQTFVDGSDIVAAHRDVSYPEIDAVNMKQAIRWPLLNDDSARLSIDVRCRGHAFGEEIVMRRVGKMSLIRCMYGMLPARPYCRVVTSRASQNKGTVSPPARTRHLLRHCGAGSGGCGWGLDHNQRATVSTNEPSNMV